MHWCYVRTLLDSTALLSEELYAIGSTFRRALMGVASDPAPEKRAYQVASRCYSEPVGVYYGRTYFGEEAKKDGEVSPDWKSPEPWNEENNEEE